MLPQTAPLLRAQGGGFSEGLVLAAISLFVTPLGGVSRIY